jgi:hypothetical protein
LHPKRQRSRETQSIILILTKAELLREAAIDVIRKSKLDSRLAKSKKINLYTIYLSCLKSSNNADREEHLRIRYLMPAIAIVRIEHPGRRLFLAANLNQ